MSGDPFFSTNPSDSGLLEGSVVPPHLNGAPLPLDEASRPRQAAPPSGPIDADDPEQSLRDVPLPDGYLTRLRRVVDDL